MTAFSLRLTRGANAVSQLHAATADATWQGISPRRHHRRHERRPHAELDRPRDGRDAGRAASGPTSTTSTRRAPAAASGSGSTSSRPTSSGRPTSARSSSWRSSPGAGCAASSPATASRRRRSTRSRAALDPDILTIGFARRFATYKRAGLLFSDVDRLARLLWDEKRPVQIVFAGKAHPADRPGQQVIQEIFERSTLGAAPRSGLHPRGLRHPRSPATSSPASTSG